MKNYNNLLQTIEYQLKNNKLVLLRTANSEWQQNFIKDFAKDYKIINLSDPMLREDAVNQPEEFVDKFQGKTLFCNIQYAPCLLPFLSASPDRSQYMAVTSQDYYIKEAYGDLDGLCIIDLPLSIVQDREPFLPVEDNLKKAFAESKNLSDIFSEIFKGNLYGESFSDKQDREQFYANYIQRFLQYDIKSLTTVSDEMKFYRFMCAAAAGISGVVNYAQLGKAADISSPTAKQWLKFLEGAGIISFLQPIESEGLKRLAKAPKLYFKDTGLACYLLRLGDAADASVSAFSDSLFENYAVMRIYNGYLQYGLEPELRYYRDSNAKEINALIKHKNILYPLEIKKERGNIKKVQKKFNLLAVFEKKNNLKIGNGCVIGIYKNAAQVDEALWQVPINAI